MDRQNSAEVVDVKYASEMDWEMRLWFDIAPDVFYMVALGGAL
jgi:hypothetical protein